MLKVLSLFIILLLVQTSHANDFLRSGKQLLVCTHSESFIRINWEDWQIENRTFSLRSKNLLIKFSPVIDRDGVEDTYRIDHSYEIYSKGKSTEGGGGGFNIGPELSPHPLAAAPYPLKLRYIDKEIVDSEIPKLCSK